MKLHVLIWLLPVLLGAQEKFEIEKLDPNMTLEKADDKGMAWLDPREAPFRLVGFPWIGEDKVYRRLPVTPNVPIRKPVDSLANNTAGGQIQFRTDSPKIILRVKLRHASGMYHIPATGQSGFDLYLGDAGKQQFVNVTRFAAHAKEYEVTLLSAGKAMRNVTLNFPLYNGVNAVEVGVAAGSTVLPPPAYTHQGRIVVYGTSITQGGCAARPGMAWPNILSRRLNAEFTNLGFSGNGKGEPELAKLINQIDNKRMIILDYEANAGDGMRKTLDPFIDILRAEDPDIPILLISKIHYATELLSEAGLAPTRNRAAFQQELVAKRRVTGDANIHFLDGGTLLGEHAHECTVDGVHPTALGFLMMANGIEPVVREVLNAGAPKKKNAAKLPSAIPGGAAFLKKYPAADENGDGVLTGEEKESFCISHTIEGLGGGYTYRKTMVPMRDGVKLATAVFVPPGKGPFPAVITRSSYGIWAAALFDVGKVAEKNVVFICQDLRGDGESEGAGTFDATSFDNEIDDGYDSIEWISQQSWSNGRVGITGQSGHGFAAYMAYLGNHPKLTAADTNISGGNATKYWTHHNGVRREMMTVWIPQRNVPVPQWPRPAIKPFDQNAYDETVKAAAADNPAVFIARTGWYDIFGESALDYFRDFGAQGKVFVRVDASGHGNMRGKIFPHRKVPEAWRLPDFTSLLHDPEGVTPNKSQLLYYQMGDVTDPEAPGNCYKVTDVWPVPHTPTSYYFGQDGGLTVEPAKTSGVSKSFAYDPRDPVPSVGGDVFIHEGVGARDQRVLMARKDILRFTSPPLAEPMEITGKVMAELFVSSDVPDTTFTVKLIDVYPDGYQAIVRDSIAMGRFHKGLDQEHPMVKGQIYKLELDLWSTSLVVNKGHRLAVHVSGSNSPKYDVHPNSFEPVSSFAGAPVATNSVHLSGKHASKIILPVVATSP